MLSSAGRWAAAHRAEADWERREGLHLLGGRGAVGTRPCNRPPISAGGDRREAVSGVGKQNTGLAVEIGFGHDHERLRCHILPAFLQGEEG